MTTQLKNTKITINTKVVYAKKLKDSEFTKMIKTAIAETINMNIDESYFKIIKTVGNENYINFVYGSGIINILVEMSEKNDVFIYKISCEITKNQK